MQVLAQWVRTSWTKQSRGAPEATLRNAAPVAFPLPCTNGPLVHEVRMDEATAFAPRSSTVDGQPPVELVILREEDELVRVQPVVDPYGMPRRHQRPPAIRIRPGEWFRWQINYRQVQWNTGAWYYQLDTLSLAYGGAAPDVFLGEPSQYLDERAYLR